MNDSEFDQWLRTAGGTSPLPSSFRSEVWRKIAAEAAAIPRWRRWLDAWLGLLMKPAVATASVVATITLGTALGMADKPDRLESENQYIRAVSPFVPMSR